MNKVQLPINSVKMRTIWFLLFVISYLFFGCRNIFEPSQYYPEPGNKGKTLVRIHIGEGSASSRTVQPGHNAIAGYQITIGSGYEPVNITEGNTAEIALAEGNWTITATAYKTGGTIGNSEDAIAMGLITISISGGEVSGSVPPIILKPVNGTGNGTLHYDIAIDSGVSGYMKLWELAGSIPVNTFGTGGTLTLSESVNAIFDYPAGRYIAEVKLANESGDIAFRREVIEIWADTTTDFIFAPVEFGDPNLLPLNYGAKLSKVNTTINGIAIGNGTGSGNSENDPMMYVFGITNEENTIELLINLEFEQESLFSTYSWVVNHGEAPGGEYPETGILPSQYAINDTLWIKTVSEDESETMYYSIMVLPFSSADYGDFSVISANASGVSYKVSYDSYYYTNSLTINTNGSYTIGMKSGVTQTTKDVIVISSGVTADITLVDVNIDVRNANFATAFYMHLATVNLTLIGGNTLRSGYNRAGLGLYEGKLHITEASTGSLSVTGGGDSQGISVLQSGSITINGGTVTSTGSNGGAGIGRDSGYSPGNITINGGTVTARGGTNGAGIGGGYYGSGGNITINGGMVNAYGGLYGAGIGGGRNNTGGTISINGGTVTATAGSGGAGIGGGGGETGTNNPGGSGGTISITGGIVTAINNSSGAGIGGGGGQGDGGRGGSGGTISISGGTVTANSGGNGAGIGGGGAGTYGTGGSGGNINISGGTVIATTVGRGAGIGGGGGSSGTGGSGSTITISGGIVIATGGSSGAGIGGGNNSTDGALYISGNAVVFASSIRLSLTTGGPAIVFNGNNGTMYGDVDLLQDTTIPSDRNLTINSQCLMIQSGVTLVNDGVITNDGVILIEDGGTLINNGIITNNDTIYIGEGGGITGVITGNQPVKEPFFVISGGSEYTYARGILTITGNGSYAISMKNDTAVTTFDRIVVSSGINANITLAGVRIDMSRYNGITAFGMAGATVNLTLVGENTLKGGKNGAGLEVPFGSTLAITAASTGSLNATGSGNGAGIGGGGVDAYATGGSSGTISINGGTITATSVGRGAGIGGGGGDAYATGGSSGTISINGGTITATSVGRGAGIGGGGVDLYGTGGSGGTISINGGTITAISSNNGAGNGAGIGGGGAATGDGGGTGGSGGTISINGGIVTATGGYNGAGIGGGYRGPGGAISINGGIVTATGGYFGAGIGGGYRGSGGTISINGGIVTATGGNYTAGIGSGYDSIGGTLTAINGNTIIFVSWIQPSLPTGENLGPAIVFVGNNGTMYGDVILQQDVTFVVGRVLDISGEQTLTVPNGITLTNNGTINNSGTITGRENINGSGIIYDL